MSYKIIIYMRMEAADRRVRSGVQCVGIPFFYVLQMIFFREKMNIMSQKLSNNWNNVETIIIYGLGAVADRFIDKIMSEFKVPYIIDQNKQGMRYKNIPVVAYETIRREIKEKKLKIVVMTSKRIYADIRRNLEKDGLIEREDFCGIEQFVVEWYKTNKNMLNIIQVNTAVTTWCSLNCKKCNMFMPHYENDKRHHYTFGEMKEDIDLLLQFVDYIFLYSFLGGEPFLNKELKDIITYVGEKYADRIGKLGLTTNGTIIPDKETLQILKKYNVMISISDYTATVVYGKKLDSFIKTLDEWNITYTRNEMTEWKDFGFPEAPFRWGTDGVCKHMENCAPLFHGINDKKLFYCHVIWSADKAGIYTVPKQDYINLVELDSANQDDRERVSRYCAGQCERGFLGFCMVCGGCGEDNDRIIAAGEQW